MKVAEKRKVSCSPILIVFQILFLSAVVLAQSTGVSETAIGTAFEKISSILLTYVVPSVCLLIVIKGAVGLMTGDPNALKTILLAVIGTVVALSAKSILKGMFPSAGF